MSIIQHTKPHYLWAVSMLSTTIVFCYNWVHTTDLRYSVDIAKALRQCLRQIEPLAKCHAYNTLSQNELAHVQSLYFHLMSLLDDVINRYGPYSIGAIAHQHTGHY